MYDQAMLTQRYPEPFIAPMREELTRVGFEELRSAEAVDQAVTREGTTLIVVNSVCGCAAGKARPGIALSLRAGARPDHLTTVFAGGDIEATERARSYMAPYAPSSPSVALMKDGRVVYMMERRDIESQPANKIAEHLQAAYEEFCKS
jgi:putative YphP/YqiW family bacilliredoxin